MTTAHAQPQPVLGTWRLDAAALTGFALLLTFALPARLVVPPLGAAGRPALLLGFCLLIWWAVIRLVPGAFAGGRNPVRWLALVFLVSLLVSYAAGFGRLLPPQEATGSDRSLIRYLGLLGLLLAVCDGISTRQRLDSLLRVLVGCATLMAAIGALQYLLEYDVTPRIRVPGLGLNGDLITVASRGAGFSRVASTAGHYIEFGVLMVLVLPLAVHFALYGRGRARRACFAGSAGLLVLCSFFSVSRSPILTLAVVMLLLVPAWSLRRKINAAAIGALFVVAVQMSQPGLLGTIRSLFRNVENDPSVEGRTSDYAVVGPLIAERPWFGRGLGTYSPERYVLLDNQWLGTLITGGVVGVTALAALLLSSVMLAKRIGRRAQDEQTRHLGHCLAAVVGAAAVVSLTFDSLSFSTFATVLFVTVGAVGALWRLEGLSLLTQSERDSRACPA